MWDTAHKNRLFLPPATWTDALDTIVATGKMIGGDGTNADDAFAKLAELGKSILTFGENPAQLSELFRSDALDIGGVYAPRMPIWMVRSGSRTPSSAALRNGPP